MHVAEISVQREVGGGRTEDTAAHVFRVGLSVYSVTIFRMHACATYACHFCTGVHISQSARREKLRLLQEREAEKARMSRLKTMLQQKLVQKYGSKR